MTNRIVELARSVITESCVASVRGVTRPWLGEARKLADEVLRVHQGDTRELYVVLDNAAPLDATYFVEIETKDGVSISAQRKQYEGHEGYDRIGPFYLSPRAPIDTVLHCWHCGVQHIDEPNEAEGWTNPPHRSHKCASCGYIWRPADVETNGVEATVTHSLNDSPIERPILREVFEHTHAQIEAVKQRLREASRRFAALAEKLANPMVVFAQPTTAERYSAARAAKCACVADLNCLYPDCRCSRSEPQKTGFWAKLWEMLGEGRS